jgi:hypothetical protein
MPGILDYVRSDLLREKSCVPSGYLASTLQPSVLRVNERQLHQRP